MIRVHNVALNVNFSMLLVWTTLLATQVFAMPSYGSLAGLSERHLDSVIDKLPGRDPLPKPPGPPKFLGTKLVNDRDHPFIAPKTTDMRGPCPGLNTMANHGYLPRNGVASPAQIIIASQEAFNMENELARFTTYAAHLLDGNIYTDLISIGDKTPLTGYDSPHPANIGGLSNHGTFEGDASLTRADFAHGDNHNFNQTLFNQFKEFSDKYGNGFFNLTVAAELRFHRTKESIATNPNFKFFGFRHVTAMAESTFPSRMFVDGRTQGTKMQGQLDMATALIFFKDMRFPKDFHRSAVPADTSPLSEIFAAHPILPGRNVNGINTYTEDNSLGGFNDFCLYYTQFVNITIKNFYPNPKGLLLKNLKINLRNFFAALPNPRCTEQFPYGN